MSEDLIQQYAAATERVVNPSPEERATNMAYHFHRAGRAHTKCWCATCETRAVETCTRHTFCSTFMHLCPDCGNKRCPRATFHGHECTGSNEPGQVGSRYGIAEVPPAAEAAARRDIYGGGR